MYFFKESRVTVKSDKHKFNGQDQSPLTKLCCPTPKIFHPMPKRGYPSLRSATKHLGNQDNLAQRERERERVHKLKVKKIIWKAKGVFGKVF